jgi:prepilin-type N-terminal cleavage/methylation domain-containing protein
MTLHTFKQKKGFTLIETLVAISILLLSIVGPLEIASKGMFSAFYARDEISAYYLAQEGLEFVRNLRDTNYLQDINGTPSLWLDSLDNSCFSDAGCSINPVNILNGYAFSDFGSVAPCASLPSALCPILEYNDTTAIFSVGSTYPQSKFRRKVKVTLDNANIATSASALVETTVSWQTGTLFSSTKSFVLRERIFNWNQ